MNKKILISLSIIGVVAAIGIGGTIAYFSDTETSVGNTFTAGTIDITLDPSSGQAVETVSGDLDLKPCQIGYTTAMVTNDGTNPAEIWKHVGNVTNEENGRPEPEKEYYNTNGWDWADALISDWIHYDMLVCKSGETSYVVEKAYNLYWGPWPSGPEYNLTDSGDELCAVNNPVDFEVIDNCDEVTFKICTPDGFETPSCCLGKYPEATFYDTAALFFDVGNDGVEGLDGYDFQVMYEPGSLYYPSWSDTDPWAYSDKEGSWHDQHWQLSDVEGVSAEKEGDCLVVTISADKLGGLGSSYGHWLRLHDETGLRGDCGEGPDQLLVTPGEEDGITVGNIIKEISEGAGWFLTYKGPKVHPDNDGYGVESNWMYLGVLDPLESMYVIQSYHLDKDVDNWGQSDKISFDVDFMAQQTTPLPPQPDNVLSGQGR